MRSATRSKREPERAPTRRVVFLAFPNAVLLDLAGPWDVFNGANLFAGPGPKPYALELVSATGDARIATAGGPPLVGSRSAKSCRGPIGTLVVPAAMGFEDEPIDKIDRSAMGHLKRLARASRRV